jgi:hypothetical protein
VRQVFVDGSQFLIIHTSDRTPRHLFVEFTAVGVDAGAHGGDELGKLPALDEIEVGPKLPGHTSGQIIAALAFSAEMIRLPGH